MGNFIENVVTVCLSIVILGILALILPLLCALVGAIAGFAISLTPFNAMILNTLLAIGVNNIDMVQIGATLGFVGSFFTSANCDKLLESYR